MLDRPPLDAPDLLLIGHVTRDLLPDGRWRLGGTVTFAALTAIRHGLRVGIVTSGPDDVAIALNTLAPGVATHRIPSTDVTTFENIYTNGARTQYLRQLAAPLALADIPDAWRSAPLVLLAPIAQEVDPALASAFPSATIAATPQGWLRQWDATGRVAPTLLGKASVILPYIQALILSREDLLLPAHITGAHVARAPRTPGEAEAQIAVWAGVTPLVVVTRGGAGATLRYQGGEPETFPGYPAHEVDPTGAGDVFATAFLLRLREIHDPRAAVDYANRVAALSIEGEGESAIPTPDQVIARYGPLR